MNKYSKIYIKINNEFQLIAGISNIRYMLENSIIEDNSIKEHNFRNIIDNVDNSSLQIIAQGLLISDKTLAFINNIFTAKTKNIFKIEINNNVKIISEMIIRDIEFFNKEYEFIQFNINLLSSGNIEILNF